ncbi:MAG: hypothetical protein ABIJ97_09350 [Bacteroidota bacterium]
MNSALVFRFLLIIIITNLFGCKKEDGKFFLRILPPTGTTITDLIVYDEYTQIPADSLYHPVDTRLGFYYTLKNVAKYSIKDWTIDMDYDEFSYIDESLNIYKGEFEKDSRDKYYTLIIEYNQVKSEPIYNQWGKYYFYSYSYHDDSQLNFSYQPE